MIEKTALSARAAAGKPSMTMAITAKAKKLKDAGVISDRRSGRWIYYALVPAALEEMRAFRGEVKPEKTLWRDGGCC